LAVPPTAAGNLTLGRYATFRREPSPYGPLWAWIGAAVVGTLGTGSLVANLLAFKVLAVLAYTLQAALIYLILCRRKPALANVGLLAFAWNPLVLYEFVANGHNDAVMMAFVLLGVFFWDRGRIYLMVAALTAALLIKIPVAFLLPLFLVAAARPRSPGRPCRIKGAKRRILLCLVASAEQPHRRDDKNHPKGDHKRDIYGDGMQAQCIQDLC
jgi:Gpi18-like mannosyltransferase